MKKIFYIGILGFILFEIANVYFIMPMPGSQEMNSIDVAYFLYTWRWMFRGLFLGMIILGFKSAFQTSKSLPIVSILSLIGIIYGVNFQMAADTMFYQPTVVSLKNLTENKIDDDKLVIGIVCDNQAKAYPIQFLGYHHQVHDTICNKSIMVTYCTVCRTGRVFEPLLNGKTEDFRLVGMDHFNAMFEDKTTKSWWRQATGEAIIGASKGQILPEFPSMQTTLSQWIKLHPNTLVMQPDTHFRVEYDSMRTYERGKLTGKLTRRDTLSWQKKSWVVGIEMGSESKAYDWNALQKERIIYDEINQKPIVLIVSKDSMSFVALERIGNTQTFSLVNDSLKSSLNSYNFEGISANPMLPNLKQVRAYQEYWHSWQTFHPKTKK
jgi:Protein of unknown function (DUF3179)